VNLSDIERSMYITSVSLKMEGFSVDPDCITLCRHMLAGEITMEEYLARVTPKEVAEYGVQY